MCARDDPHEHIDVVVLGHRLDVADERIGAGVLVEAVDDLDLAFADETAVLVDLIDEHLDRVDRLLAVERGWSGFERDVGDPERFVRDPLDLLLIGDVVAQQCASGDRTRADRTCRPLQ